MSDKKLSDKGKIANILKMKLISKNYFYYRAFEGPSIDLS